MNKCNKMTVAIDKQASDILIFKTGLKTKGKVSVVEPILNALSSIAHWSIDTKDFDNVLRIVSKGELEESRVINLVQQVEFNCETLYY